MIHRRDNGINTFAATECQDNHDVSIIEILISLNYRFGIKKRVMMIYDSNSNIHYQRF